MSSGHQVTVLDNFYTGRRSNLQRWVGHPNFRLITHDIVEPILLEVDEVYHLACPSAPMHYQVGYDENDLHCASVVAVVQLLSHA